MNENVTARNEAVSMRADCFTAFHFVRNDAFIEDRHRERSVTISKEL